MYSCYNYSIPSGFRISHTFSSFCFVYVLLGTNATCCFFSYKNDIELFDIVDVLYCQFWFRFAYVEKVVVFYSCRHDNLGSFMNVIVHTMGSKIFHEWNYSCQDIACLHLSGFVNVIWMIGIYGNLQHFCLLYHDYQTCWGGKLEQIRLSDWCCSVSLVLVQISSRENKTFAAQKYNSKTVGLNFQTYIYTILVKCLKNIKFMCMRLKNWNKTEVHWAFPPVFRHIRIYFIF